MGEGTRLNWSWEEVLYETPPPVPNMECTKGASLFFYGPLRRSPAADFYTAGLYCSTYCALGDGGGDHHPSTSSTLRGEPFAREEEEERASDRERERETIISHMKGT